MMLRVIHRTCRHRAYRREIDRLFALEKK